MVSEATKDYTKIMNSITFWKHTAAYVDENQFEHGKTTVSLSSGSGVYNPISQPSHWLAEVSNSSIK